MSRAHGSSSPFGAPLPRPRRTPDDCVALMWLREDRPSGPDLFEAAGDDGGLTANQVDVLKRLYGMRNELQHASPGVQASEVYDDILLLTKTLGRSQGVTSNGCNVTTYP